MAGKILRSASDVTAERVLGEAEAAWRRRQDLGLRNRVFNLLLEPRNPFDPKRRRVPKKDLVVIAFIAAFALAAVIYFNLTAFVGAS
jgi:hypothetical protein